VTAPDTRAAVLAFALDRGLLADGEPVTLTALAGGVSCDLWKVETPARTICVKLALARLKVAGEWLAPMSRNRVECDWLRYAAPICPGQVPVVLADDPDGSLFAMEYLPPDRYPLWKARLLAGEVDARAAGEVRALIGRLHAGSAADRFAPARFATDDNFEALRIGPYLRATAARHPELADRFDHLARRTASTRLAVVHGDLSASLIPALALARIDGLSPVEYLEEAQRETVRRVSRSLLQAPQENPDELFGRWTATA
jgi:hypothetical protein